MKGNLIFLAFLVRMVLVTKCKHLLEVDLFLKKSVKYIVFMPEL